MSFCLFLRWMRKEVYVKLSRDIVMELVFRPVSCNNNLYCFMHDLIGRSLVTWLIGMVDSG